MFNNLYIYTIRLYSKTHTIQNGNIWQGRAKNPINDKYLRANVFSFYEDYKSIIKVKRTLIRFYPLQKADKKCIGMTAMTGLLN